MGFIMESIVYKRLYELKRQKFFLALSTLFYLLWPLIVVILFVVFSNLSSGTSTTPNQPLGEVVETEVSWFSRNLFIFASGTYTGFPQTYPKQRPGFPKFFLRNTEEEIFREYPPYNPAFAYSFTDSNITVFQPPVQEFGAGYSQSQFSSISAIYAPLLALQGTGYVVRDYPEHYDPNLGGGSSSNGQNDNAAIVIFPFYGPIVFCLGLTCGILSVGILVARDRRAKMYFYRAGLRPLDYWKGNIAVDGTLFLIWGALSLAMMFAASVSPLSYQWPVVILFVLFGSVSSMLFAHWLSFWFDREETATRWLFFVTIFSYMVLSVMVLMIPMTLNFGPPDPNSDPNKSTSWTAGFAFALVFPPCTVLGGLIEVSNYVASYPVDQPIDIVGSFARTGVIAYVIVAALQIPIILFFIICHETSCFKRRKNKVQYIGVQEEATIKVKNLSVSYTSCCGKCKKRKDAVNNLDVEFDNGVFALLGKNGAGKSSLFSVLSGDNSKHSGTATIFGLDCYYDRYEIRKHASFVEQFDVPLDLLSVGEFLLTVAKIRRLDNPEQQINEHLRSCDLTASKDKMLSELSGGMRRKCSLLAALLSPDLKMLLLDEPTTGIDIGSKRELHKLIIDVANRGGAVWMCSHSMDEVSLLASHVGVMDHGQMIQSGKITMLEEMYGKRILIRVSTLHPNEVLEFLKAQQNAKNLNLTIELQSASALQLTLDSNAVNIEQVFAMMRDFSSRNPGMQLKYTVSDATLSSAFVKFIEEQEVEN